MKKEDFICPCCGLPNHLEFQNKQLYQNLIDNGVVLDGFRTDGEGNVFNNYIINEENLEGVSQELGQRLKKICSYTNYYDKPDRIEDWLNRHVVCFIKDGEEG